MSLRQILRKSGPSFPHLEYNCYKIDTAFRTLQEATCLAFSGINHEQKIREYLKLGKIKTRQDGSLNSRDTSLPSTFNVNTFVSIEAM